MHLGKFDSQYILLGIKKDIVLHIIMQFYTVPALKITNGPVEK